MVCTIPEFYEQEYNKKDRGLVDLGLLAFSIMRFRIAGSHGRC